LAAEGWDEVRVEPFIDPIRPDILLVKAGDATLAIEVRATHAVTEVKATRLSDHGIPWVEVAAGAASDAWTPGAPMPALRYESKVASRFCSAHSSQDAANATHGAHPAAARARTAHALSAHRDLDNHGERWRFRVIDCYPYQGTRVRRVFWVYYTRLTALTSRLRVANETEARVVAEIRKAARSEESLRKVHDLLRQYLQRTYERFDSPRPWLDSDEFPENPAKLYLKEFMPVKYHRDSNGAWTTRAGETDDNKNVELTARTR
jgi:hypothetical protein